MAGSLSLSLYNAITPYPQEGELSYVDCLSDSVGDSYAMEGDMTHIRSLILKEADFMNSEDHISFPDETILTDFSHTGDYSNLTWHDVNIGPEETCGLDFRHDLSPGSAGDITDENISDSGSDFPSDDSFGSEQYEASNNIMKDEPTHSEYLSAEVESYQCHPMNQIYRHHLETGPGGMKKKPGRKKGQVSKVLHLWEFIRDLLNDPKFCPRIITWENKSEGVFRVVKSTEVAKLWGEKKKNKKKMTYEKMSRSMRYSRKEGYFLNLPKDRGYPKKLCFRFGPKSYGWK